MKQRWWWSLYNHEDLIFKNNFLWTQWRKNKHLAVLPAKNPVVNAAMIQLAKEAELEKKEENQQDYQEEQDGEDPIDRSNPMSLKDELLFFKNKMYNRLEDNYHLSNKKALFWNMSQYYESMDRDIDDALPMTFHIDHGVNDPEFRKFVKAYHKVDRQILKI